VRSTPTDQVVELAVVDVSQCDGVDLDAQARLLRRLDALQDPIEPATSRYPRELVGIEGVDGDIHPPHARCGQLFGISAELTAVAGECQLVERAGSEVAAETAEQHHDVPANQRLASRDPQLADTAADEGGAQPIDLLERKNLRLGQEGHLFRHAVDAAEVAAIGHRDPEVADPSPERIDHDPSLLR
jgi:hypothetical protein